jgi:DNA-binding beta-propeller fold protein YncE
MRIAPKAIGAACALAMALSLAPTAQAAHPGNKPQPAPATEVAAHLISPLKVAFGPNGSLLVAESFAGMLTSIASDGTRTTLVNAPGQEIAGVSHLNGTTYYFNNDMGNGPEPGAELLPARLMAMDSNGASRQLADLSDFEAANNPDSTTVYGVRDATPECLAQAPWMGPTTGEVFSHPYSSVPVAGGVYVGDAGANGILFVSNSGGVSLVKALAPEPVLIDASLVAAVAAGMELDVPECMLGHTYYSQAVPTDIAVKGQWLYYSVLPGVPGELLGIGKVYRTNLQSGTTQLVAAGLGAPTGIAVGQDNTVYVAELMGGGVSSIKNGTTTTVLPAMMAAHIAISGNTMVALTNALDDQVGGSLVKMSLK